MDCFMTLGEGGARVTHSNDKVNEAAVHWDAAERSPPWRGLRATGLCAEAELNIADA
jgi:hypothetical protein